MATTVAEAPARWLEQVADDARGGAPSERYEQEVIRNACALELDSLELTQAMVTRLVTKLQYRAETGQ